MESTQTLHAPIHDRIRDLVLLKDFAIDRGYTIPEKLLREIGDLSERLSVESGAKPRVDTNMGSGVTGPIKVGENQSTVGETVRESAKLTTPEINLAELDRLLMELTAITYPVTRVNVRQALDGKNKRFIYSVLLFGLVAAALSGYFGYLVNNPSKSVDALIVPFARAGLSLLLGMVGAIVYIMLPNGRLNLAVGLDGEGKANDIVRIALGGLLGFVLDILSTTATDNQKVGWTLLFPLLGGYSITLVVGILSKAVAAAQLTFNIDEKSARASVQK